MGRRGHRDGCLPFWEDAGSASTDLVVFSFTSDFTILQLFMKLDSGLDVEEGLSSNFI